MTKQIIKKTIDLSFTLEGALDLYGDLLDHAVKVDSIQSLIFRLKAAITLLENENEKAA